MLFRNRPDGRPADVPGFTKMLPILMPTRTESTIFMDQTLVLDRALDFIGRWNENRPEGRRPLTVMQVLLTALARTVAERPALNRFVSHYRHYQRNNISVSFVTKQDLTDDGKEMNVIMPFRPNDTLETVNERFTRYVGEVKKGDGNKSGDDVDALERLPVFVLRLIVGLIRLLDRRNWISKGPMRMLPFYATVFMTNVGSLRLDAPYHHNFEMGTTGIFVSLGLITAEKRLGKDGKAEERRVVSLRYTFDDRIVDGIYSGKAMRILKELVENPEMLLEPPHIAPERLEELALTEKGWKIWAKEGESWS